MLLTSGKRYSLSFATFSWRFFEKRENATRQHPGEDSVADDTYSNTIQYNVTVIYCVNVYYVNISCDV